MCLDARLGAILLGVALALFWFAETTIAEVNGWWIDELKSFHISDPSQSIDAVAKGLTLEANPPLFFVALYVLRDLLDVGRQSAVVILNFAAVLCAIAVVIYTAFRAGMGGFGLAIAAVFILTGPIELYVLEARSYAIAMAIAFAAAWACALAIEAPAATLGSIGFAVLGVLSALTHTYAAILCGSLGAVLILLGYVTSRPELAWRGLALAGTATAVFVAWLVVTGGGLQTIDWIKFTPDAVREAVWYFKKLAIGGRPVALLLLALLVLGALRASTRTLVITLGAAVILFFALPLIASIWKPMIGGRYWSVGAPVIVVLVGFLARSWWIESMGGERQLGAMLGVAGALLFFVASGIYGFAGALELAAGKPIWKGAAIVRPLLQGCPNGSVRVFGDPTYVPGFAEASDAPATLFEDASLQQVQPISVASMRCPVLGWAEHVRQGDDFLASAPDAALLKLLKIDAASEEVKLLRHESGFVVVRRDS